MSCTRTSIWTIPKAGRKRVPEIVRPKISKLMKTRFKYRVLDRYRDVFGDPSRNWYLFKDQFMSIQWATARALSYKNVTRMPPYHIRRRGRKGSTRQVPLLVRKRFYDGTNLIHLRYMAILRDESLRYPNMDARVPSAIMRNIEDYGTRRGSVSGYLKRELKSRLFVASGQNLMKRSTHAAEQAELKRRALLPYAWPKYRAVHHTLEPEGWAYSELKQPDGCPVEPTFGQFAHMAYAHKNFRAYAEGFFWRALFKRFYPNHDEHNHAPVFRIFGLDWRAMIMTGVPLEVLIMVCENYADRGYNIGLDGSEITRPQDAGVGYIVKADDRHELLERLAAQRNAWRDYAKRQAKRADVDKFMSALAIANAHR